jgi:hypothetical protein
VNRFLCSLAVEDLQQGSPQRWQGEGGESLERQAANLGCILQRTPATVRALLFLLLLLL